MTTAPEPRFACGENWERFLKGVDEESVAEAQASLRAMLETSDLAGKTFLDAGCGSGLFSLAARRLGAVVRSFDVDARSVGCAQALRSRFSPEDAGWMIERGSALDPAYLANLGAYDVVYSWGVLHHTGDLWRALDLVSKRVAPEGLFVVAIYNDQGWRSRAWRLVKRLYNRLPRGLRWPLSLAAFADLWLARMTLDLWAGRPFATWRRYRNGRRGMSPWRDVIDWVGGYPYEVAKPEEVFDFCRARGFSLRRLRTVMGGHGCNEFVFAKEGAC